MKITAIRIAEFCKFSDPIALEGLSGGLDVLCGPNELGKSTILSGMKLALTTKASAKGGAIEALRPYRGGAPTVEIDFVCGGRQWRLFKRWLTQSRVELRELGAGSRMLRGAEAEAELERLLAAHGGPAGAPLLWVDQGQSCVPFDVAEKDRGLLDGAIAGEVATMLGADRARRIRQRVDEALSLYVTDKHGRPRQDYAAALAHAKQKAEALAHRREQLATVEEQLRQLADLRDRERALADPLARAQRMAAAERARAVLEAGRTASARAEQAGHERRTAQSRLALAQNEHAALGDALARLADLDRVDLAESLAASEAAARSVALGARLADARSQLEQAHAAMARFTAEHAAALTVQRRLAARARVLDIATRLQAARAAQARAAELEAQIGACRVTADLVQAARSEAATVRDLETRLSASAAVVTVAHLPGASSRIRVRGRDLADGETLTADRPLVLEIENVGTITVWPGGGAATQDTARQRDTHREHLAALLATGGADNLDDLQTAFAERTRWETRLLETRAQGAALSTGGLGALEDALEEARAEADDAAGEPTTRAIADIQADLDAARERVTEHDAEIAALSRALADEREAEAGRAAACRARAEQRARDVAVLPPATEREARATALASALDEARVAADDAVRTHSVWLAQAPDPAASARAAADVATAQAESDRVDRALAACRADTARVEGALASLRNEDVAGVVAELTDEVDLADAAVQRIEREIAALRRLQQELGREADADEAQFSAPIRARLLPWLHMVFPGAVAHVGPDFHLRGLARADGAEVFARLSQGTREQIAVLSRLAFGRLLADSGRPVPVVLDDALVFSDDERIKAMFRALEEAAHAHQVLVLTCRSSGFADLAGRKLELRAWERVDA